MTRNFVVQGTAAEWALCWMGRVRSRLLTETVFGMPMRTKIVYFLHDELLLCGPKLEAAFRDGAGGVPGLGDGHN